ncbi:unnamed protein product [marine sediment metagenome]|uniref:Uncharacterized protein n=1 Tax=marine sediment metagenome TaxID=412755 RepID=X0S3B3_9ZZZZ
MSKQVTVASLATKVAEQDTKLDSILELMKAQLSGVAVAEESAPVAPLLPAQLHPWHCAALPIKKQSLPFGEKQPPEVQIAQGKVKSRVSFHQLDGNGMRIDLVGGTPEYRSSSQKATGMIGYGKGVWNIDGHEVTVQVTAYYTDPVLQAQLEEKGKVKQ